MALRFVENPTYRRPVTVRWPDRNDEFVAVFRVPTAKEFRELLAPIHAAEKRIGGDATVAAEEVAVLDDAIATLLGELMVDWDEVVGEDGVGLAFERRALEKLLTFGPVRAGLWAAWTAATGVGGKAQQEVREGFSEPSPAP